MKLFFKLHILPYIAFAFHRLLSWTWKVELHIDKELESDWKNERPTLYAHWHKDETVLIVHIRHFNAGILNSKSSDGQMMAKIVRLYGAKTAKGSSSRDGVEALKGLVRLTLKEKRNPTVAVDGPRGPYQDIKPGIFQLSRLTGAKIYPAAVKYSSAWQFPKAWDKAYLPKPFAKVTIQWGPPMEAITKKQDPKNPELAQKLKEHFDKVEALAANHFTGQKEQDSL